MVEICIPSELLQKEDAEVKGSIFIISTLENILLRL